jgi:short-subunit dehydrogenase
MEAETRLAIAGKVVIVTGASSGIGEATAWEFGQWKAKTVLAARRADRLERLAERIRNVGGIALPVPTDLTDSKQVSNLVQQALSNFERIDVLVNIAGWGHYDWFEELTNETLRQQYEVNIIGMAELIRQVLPTMKEQRSGIIINMSSYSSRISVPPLTVYSSTKSAVEGLSDGLRRELAPWGIKVIRVHPSAVTGTEFKEKAIANGGVNYATSPIGRVSREAVARKLVELVENPQRSLFIGRTYDVPVVINALFPRLVDLFSAFFVKFYRRKELPLTQPISMSRNQPSIFGGYFAMLSVGVLIVGWFLRKKL